MRGIYPEQLHHTYIIAGDRRAIVADLTDFIEKKLEVPTRANPDFWQREFESFSVADARDVQQLQQNKTLGKLQVFIISAAELTGSAQQSFLKVTEEPSPQTCFFFVVPNIDMLLPTLRSRAVVIEHGADSKKSKINMDTFMEATPAERLKLVGKLHRSDGVNKEEVMQFLDQLEEHVAGSGKKEVLHDIYSTKKKLRATGVSVKMLLEHLTLLVPFQK